MKALRLLLFPFSILYDLATRLRNHLYNTGYKHAVTFDRPVISVGNLSVGGTGKTPMVEYLVSLLTPAYRVATLSRGYGRRTRGFRLAQPDDTADSIGDEPMQYRLKFGEETAVCVGEDRVLAIAQLLQEKPETDLIILDDAYQHRAVQPQCNILLTEYGAPFFADHVLPAGNLREARVGASRADVVVVTKCPDTLTQHEKKRMTEELTRYTHRPVFFSFVGYGKPRPVFKATWHQPTYIILLTGIAHAGPLCDYLKTNSELLKHFEYPDHHRYTELELAHVVDYYTTQQNLQPTIVTTEKDMVRLLAYREMLQSLPLFYIPIVVQFPEGGSDFDKLILTSIKS